MIGVEALARWHRADRVLDTQLFLALAEKTGSIVEIGRRVMQRACEDVTRWSREHPDRAPLRLAVNLSLHQLTELDAVEQLEDLLGSTGFDPQQLTLEVSEDALHELGHAVGPTLLALKQLGIRLSVDDFGTGASSLVALQRYQLDELKIDRSFIAESAPIGMVLIDETGRHLAANPAVGRLLGRDLDALLDMTCWEAVHPEDLLADLAAMDQLLRGECPAYVLEERVVGTDGRPRWVEVTVSCVPGDHQANGTPARLLRQIRSIEDSHRASEDAAVLRSVVAATPDALIITDELGRCTLWNPAAERLFGWTEQEMLGASLARLVGADSQLHLARALADATAGLAVRWADATWLSSTGEARAVDVTVGPVVDASGTRIGLVTLARDVTDQRVAGIALSEAHEALGLHAAELGAANVRLATFAGTLCHDLMQPVAALDGFISLLEQAATELDDEHRSWLAGVRRGKDRVAQAIDALYRNAADEDLPLVEVDLARVVSELVPGLVAELGDAQVIVGDLPVIAADRGLVTQVLANLVQNAGRYRHDERALVVDLNARSDGLSSWVVVVADSGKGISTDELERVFEPGQRGRSAEGVDGTGTGLATVRTLMQRMGGEVWAEPEPAGGVRMCLRFQAAPTDVTRR